MPHLKRDEECYLDLSGPHVWPCLSADRVCDRFIHQRPEVRYLSAKAKLNHHVQKLVDKGVAVTCSEDRLAVSIIRRDLLGETGRTYRQRQTVGSFVHHFIDDPIEDVRTFLQNLRSMLARKMPDTSSFSISVEIIFKTEEKSFEFPQSKGYAQFCTFSGQWS